MAKPVTDYADFVLLEFRRKAKGLTFEAEKESRTRLSLSFTKDGRLYQFRILMFAVGGSGRGNANERRVEITSTYASGLKRNAEMTDIVLGIERERKQLVGIDAQRLSHGGKTSNASTFVYSAGFDTLSSSPYDVLVNPSKLISDERQIYMRGSFLVDYLLNVQSLHRLGVIAGGAAATKLSSRKIISPDDPAEPKSTAELPFEQQVRLAMLKMEVGQAGERKALSRERGRLVTDGHHDLSKRVRWISQTHPYLGYDISSFGESRQREVVEVKSSTGKLRRFHFSNNELRVSEKMRVAYRIVCVSYVFDKPSFHEIRDPATSLEAGLLQRLADGYVVTL